RLPVGQRGRVRPRDREPERLRLPRSGRRPPQVSYAVSKTTGTVDNNDSSIFGYKAEFFETPTLALVNSYGPVTFGGPHEFKLLATYQVPKIDLNLNGYYRYLRCPPT